MNRTSKEKNGFMKGEEGFVGRGNRTDSKEDFHWKRTHPHGDVGGFQQRKPVAPSQRELKASLFF